MKSPEIIREEIHYLRKSSIDDYMTDRNDRSRCFKLRSKSKPASSKETDVPISPRTIEIKRPPSRHPVNKTEISETSTRPEETFPRPSVRRKSRDGEKTSSDT